ncbi:AMP-binding protein [Intrasporangium sp.]|uniref:AMP-binding protein n=1 Tax=Intrasporangium sp. TaxID=1925024 RepID=UPI00293B1D14|nr:AMP-binding protein [Intrasporangium sp.]MDV3221168.1 AMP-binding protein [Intrasporangium sp.]
MRESYATVLETVAVARPDSKVVTHAGRDVTWRQLDDEASRLAAHLRSAGIGRGDRVAVALFNGPEYLASLWGILKLRAVPVNVNFRYRSEEIRALFDDADVAAIVHDVDLSGEIDSALGRVRRAPVTLVVLGGSRREDRRIPYAAVLGEHEPLPHEERGDDDWLMYTGGTTGRPRGVIVRHSWLYAVTCANSFRLMGIEPPATLEELRAYLAGVPADEYPIVTVPAPPLMHATGSYTSLGALIAGGRVAYLAGRSYDPDELLRLVVDERADTVSIVGDVFARPLADALERAAAEGRPYDLSNLKRILSVGVTWGADSKRRILAHADIVCRDIVAASEGGPFAVNESRRGEETVTGKFVLMPGARVVDDEGNDVIPGSGQIGMLAAPADDYIHYQGDPEKTRQTFREFGGQRWVVPGDMASVETDGTVTFHGRGSQVVNTGGEKVFAEEVESIVLLHPSVRDVMVVGVPDERWGSRVAAVVTLNEGTTLTLDELREHVGRHLAGYKRPTVLVVRDELKRSPSGKADTRWAKQVATESTPSTPQ